MTTSRERMLAALEYANPDKIPVVYHPSPAGLHVHGQKLLDLFTAYPPDNPITFDRIPAPPPRTVGANGQYHETRTDEWGTTFEWRIFGLNGHPTRFPILDISKGGRYRFPAVPKIGSPAFRKTSAAVDIERPQHLIIGGVLSIFEKLCALHPMDRVLVELASGDRHLLAFLDRMVQYWIRAAKVLMATGIEVLCFFDDWGIQASQIISPKLFREVFTPRYRRIIRTIHRADCRVMFHSCGKLGPILDELIDLGVDLIWPQLPLYDEVALAHKCRGHGISMYIHPDRQYLIPLGTPAEIEAEIRKYADRHHELGGGGIFYVEIENDAPFENVRTLIESVHRYR